MKSLVLSEIYPPRVGGSGQWLHDIYSRSSSERTLLLVGDHTDAATFDRKSNLQIIRSDLTAPEWTVMTSAGRKYFWNIFKKIRHLANTHNIDEVHCARVMPEGVVGYMAATLLKKKLVCFIHGEDIELARYSRESRWLVNRILNASSRLICNSRNTEALLDRHWGNYKAKSRVLYPGIDTHWYAPTDNREKLRTEFGWSNKRVLLTVSRLEERKGHDILIKSLPQLISLFPDLHYAIVGSGSDEAKLKQLAAELKVTEVVSFHGECSLETLRSALQACDIFVLPNRQVGSSLEGFGIVLLEAQACARPVIAGDSGGTSETMIPGKTGLIVDCTETGPLIGALSDLLNDTERLEQMGKDARKLMENQFSWDVLTSRIPKDVFVGS